MGASCLLLRCVQIVETRKKTTNNYKMELAMKHASGKSVQSEALV
jgi:hypothetical protein